jgi:hypothetical protein
MEKLHQLPELTTTEHGLLLTPVALFDLYNKIENKTIKKER